MGRSGERTFDLLDKVFSASRHGWRRLGEWVWVVVVVVLGSGVRCEG